MKFSIIFVGILDNILRLHHGVELFNFCKGLEQANLLPSPPDLCDLERKRKLVNHLNPMVNSKELGKKVFLEIHTRDNVFDQVLI